MVRRILLAFGLAALVLLIGQHVLWAGPGSDEAKVEAKKADDKKPEAKKDTKKADASRPVVPVFRLHGSYSESPVQDDFLFGAGGQVSFKDLIGNLKKAATDPAVKAVVLLMDGASMGGAQREEVRQTLAKIRAAGKEIYAHADSMGMGDYILAAGASRISVVPTGDLWITGLYGEAPYVRKLLDKIGVQPDFLTCGAYKSAAEIFMRDGPSPAAEEMQNWLLDSMFGSYVHEIAKGRSVDVDKVHAWINNGPYTAEKAKTAGLIDAIEHRQDLTALLKDKYGKNVVFNKKYGGKKGPKLELSSPFAIFNIFEQLLNEGKNVSDKDAVGIVYVDGAILLGSGQISPLGGDAGAYSTAVRKALDEAARDDSIKAVVLRVDSPGGSAVASEIILNATLRVKAKKPFVVSMGDVAGSGGYYVACGSDTIFADDTTITGSIGVVSGKFATTEMWNKVGINFKAYKRGDNAGMLASDHVFSKDEHERMQAYMDEIYGVFKGHVMAIRGQRLKKPIDELAGGRVYTGKQALDLGLVDKIGSLEDAIRHVAGQAKLSDYDVRVVPRPKNFLEQLIEESSGGKENTHEVDMSLRRPLARPSGSLLDLAAPYLQHLDPQRVRQVKQALLQLQLLQEEGVLMMMPQIRTSY
jgi:protease-4